MNAPICSRPRGCRPRAAPAVAAIAEVGDDLRRDQPICNTSTAASRGMVLLHRSETDASRSSPLVPRVEEVQLRVYTPGSRPFDGGDGDELASRRRARPPGSAPPTTPASRPPRRAGAESASTKRRTDLRRRIARRTSASVRQHARSARRPPRSRPTSRTAAASRSCRHSACAASAADTSRRPAPPRRARTRPHRRRRADAFSSPSANAGTAAARSPSRGREREQVREHRPRVPPDVPVAALHVLPAGARMQAGEDEERLRVRAGGRSDGRTRIAVLRHGRTPGSTRRTSTAVLAQPRTPRPETDRPALE